VLNQTYPNYEVWVFDDASGDETGSIVTALGEQDSRVKYFCHPQNIGMMANFRFSTESVKTDYFSMVCDDDLLLPTFYETALSEFYQYSEAAFVSTAVINLDEYGNLTELSPNLPPGLYRPPQGLLDMIQYSKAPFAGTLYRGTIVDALGAHDVTLRGASDTDFDLRIAAHFPFVVTATPGAAYAVHAASTSVKATYDFVWSDIIQIAEKLRLDESIPPEVRVHASTSLRVGLERYMFNLGIVNLLRARYDESRNVARLFRNYYHQPIKGLLLTSLVLMCQYAPPIRHLLHMWQRKCKERLQSVASSVVDTKMRQQLAWIHEGDYELLLKAKGSEG
jgi:glycosyltransferase involved in cell wall biosynthesis